MEKSKIKELVIVFENCESCKITPDMFSCLIVDGVKKEIRINCYQYENGELQELETCEYFHIKLNEKGLNEKGWLEKRSLLDRVLDYSDITGVELIYENDEKEKILMPWNEEDEYINKYQESNYNEEKKMLEITIAKKGG